MAAGNRSPLGFGVILLFHLCVLGAGVMLENVYERYGGGTVFYLTLASVAAGLGSVAIVARGFYWDLFRGFKSAAVLLTLLVCSCILGTLFIQDLDLRRDGVFDSGLVEPGKKIEFNDRNQFTRFALAESHAWLWLFPNAERKEAMAKIALSDTDKLQVAQRREAFGDRAARAYEEAILASQRRHEEQRTTTNFASDNREFFYTFYTWIRKLRLFTIFESWWFYMLLGLIAVNVMVGTFVRAPWNLRDLGIAVTHSGILIILCGALLDLFVAKEGYIYFTYGRPEQQVSNTILDQKSRGNRYEGRTKLPFHVYLERFATEYYHELLVERFDWTRRHDGKAWPTGNGPPPGGRPFSVGDTFPVRQGVPWQFEDGSIEVVVHAYKPRVRVETVVRDEPKGPLMPAVKVGLYNNPQGGTNYFVHGNSEPWLFAFDERRYALDRFGTRFEYVWAEDEGEYRRLLAEAPLPDNGELILKIGAEARRERVALGYTRRLELGGQALEVQFLKIQSLLAEDENVNLDPKLQRTEQPALYLRVNGQVLSVYRDDAAFTTGFHVLPGLEFRFDWPNPEDSGVEAIARIVGGPGLPTVLVQAAPDKPQVDGDGVGAAANGVRVDELAPGRPVALVKLEGGYLGVEGSVARAREAREVVEVPDEDFLSQDRAKEDTLLGAWADVEIRGPWGTVRRELTPFDRAIFYGPEGQLPLYAFALRGTRQQRDWFSVLSVLKDGAQGSIDPNGNLVFRPEDKVETHTVQVNSPLRHRGWRFFQATAGTDADGLGVSGISVTYNPGVNFMYLGYLVLTFGVTWIFFFRPVLDRRRRARAARAREETNA